MEQSPLVVHQIGISGAIGASQDVADGGVGEGHFVKVGVWHAGRQPDTPRYAPEFAGCKGTRPNHVGQ